MYFCLVLAALSDGRIVELEIDSNAADGHTRRWCHVNAVQSTMSNSLSNIGQTGECLTRVKLDSEAKDSVLEQLAIAGSLLHSRSVSPIHCSIVASLDQSSSPPCCRIIARLSNAAGFALGHEWTFLMSVASSSKCCKDHSCCYKSCNAGNCNLFTSCDVSGLKPGVSESLSLVVDENEHSSIEVFHTVQTTLIYTPVNQTDASNKQVSVPLATQVVDILDFVQLASSPAKSLHSSQRSNFATECHRLQQLCRPHVRDNGDSKSVDELELKKKRGVASAKEHVISLYASKTHNIQGTSTHWFVFVITYWCTLAVFLILYILAY